MLRHTAISAAVLGIFFGCALNAQYEMGRKDPTAPHLKVVSNFAVGFNNVDVPACTARGVFVGNTPGVLTDATADIAVTLLLAAARRLGESSADAKAGR